MKQVPRRAYPRRIQGIDSLDADCECLPPSRDQLGDLLLLEVEFRQVLNGWCSTVAHARTAEQFAQRFACRGDTGQRRAKGCGIGKMSTPGAKREAVAHARE